MSERTASEWAIRDVARATGLTSRTLRHYEQIGLLLPSRIASTGYRYYGEPELARLYRILSLRALELPLADIRRALDERVDLATAMRAQLDVLTERREHLAAQIASVQHALSTLEKGTTMTLDDRFAGVDNAEHEQEVRQRWGDAAWERSQRRRESLTDEQRELSDEQSADVNGALRSAAESGAAPTSPEFQALVTEHHAWLAQQWARRPEREAYLGLADLYVDDDRFADYYGGRANAELIRDAIRHWAAAHL